MSARTVYVSVDWDGDPIGVFTERYMAELSGGDVYEMELTEPVSLNDAQEDQG